MPRTALDVQTTSRLTMIVDPDQQAADAANGMSFDNSSQRVMLRITNGGAVTLTVTVVIPGTFEGIARPDVPFELLAGEVGVIGPWTSAYNNADNTVYLDFDVDTDVTLEVFELGVS